MNIQNRIVLIIENLEELQSIHQFPGGGHKLIKKSFIFMKIEKNK